MEKDLSSIKSLVKKIYTTNKDTLLDLITDLKEVLGGIKNERTFKKMESVIINMNQFINNYKKKIEIELKALDDLEKKFGSNIAKNKTKKINEEIIYDNGKYIGEEVDGKREGKGIYFFNDGDVYDGEWKDGKKEGKGIYYFKDGDVYEGYWKNNNFQGKGIYYHKSGDIYDGEYYNNQRHGKGIYYFIGGSRYEGDWIDDKKDGQGVYYFIDGERKMGDYSNGENIGKHVTVTKDGTIYTDTY